MVPSMATKNDLEGALRNSRLPILINPVPFFDFRNVQACNHNHISKMKKTFVYVSTVLPRKNHRLLFNEVMNNPELRINVNFLIIGRIPRSGKWIVRAIKDVNSFGGNMKILSGVKDACLKNIYQNSYGGIYLSKAEGYGLPIHEQLQFDKRVIVSSNLRSLFEDHQKGIIWFNPDTKGDLGEKILEEAALPEIGLVRHKTEIESPAAVWEQFKRNFTE
jgi:glycosyltransferase involved in cell wall biosynthesis